MFTTVVAASKRHAHIGPMGGKGAYRISAVIISANSVHFRVSYVTDFSFLGEKWLQFGVTKKFLCAIITITKKWHLHVFR